MTVVNTWHEIGLLKISYETVAVTSAHQNGYAWFHHVRSNTYLRLSLRWIIKLNLPVRSWIHLRSLCYVCAALKLQRDTESISEIRFFSPRRGRGCNPQVKWRYRVFKIHSKNLQIVSAVLPPGPPSIDLGETISLPETFNILQRVSNSSILHLLFSWVAEAAEKNAIFGVMNLRGDLDVVRYLFYPWAFSFRISWKYYRVTLLNTTPFGSYTTEGSLVLTSSHIWL